MTDRSKIDTALVAGIVFTGAVVFWKLYKRIHHEDRPTIRVRNGGSVSITCDGKFEPGGADDWFHMHATAAPKKFVVAAAGTNSECWAGCTDKVKIGYHDGSDEQEVVLESKKKNGVYRIQVKTPRGRGKKTKDQELIVDKGNSSAVLKWVDFGHGKGEFNSATTPAEIIIYLTAPGVASPQRRGDLESNEATDSVIVG